MEIVFTEQFEQAFERITKTDRQRVKKAFSLLGNDPRHTGLYAKKMEGVRNIWEARASLKLRITFTMSGETITLRNVGAHDKVLKNP